MLLSTTLFSNLSLVSSELFLKIPHVYTFTWGAKGYVQFWFFWNFLVGIVHIHIVVESAFGSTRDMDDASTLLLPHLCLEEVHASSGFGYCRCVLFLQEEPGLSRCHYIFNGFYINFTGFIDVLSKQLINWNIVANGIHNTRLNNNFDFSVVLLLF